MSLAKYNRVVLNGAGEGVAAFIEVKSEVSGQPLATIYSDRDGTLVLGNPFTANSDGSFGFHVVGGAYQVRAYTGASGSPTFEKILRYEAIGLNSESDSIAQRTQRIVTAAGTDTITTSDADDIIIRKTAGAASRVILPLSSAVTKSTKVVDGKFDAATNNITVVPKRPSTVTISIASPGVVTLAAHGRAANDPVSFETTGALPTGLSADTQYYVKTVLSSSTLTVSLTPGGTVIDTSGTQSGVHTMGADTIMGGASYIIDSNGASIQLTPLSGGGGWY